MVERLGVGDVRKGPGVTLGRAPKATAAILTAFFLLPAPVLARPEGGAVEAVGNEAVRWWEDSVALVKAPASWDRGDWTVLGGTLAGTGALMAGDRNAYDWAVRNQSFSRDSTAKYVSKLGAEYSIALSAGLLAGGLAFGNREVRDTGRDAIEASVLTGILTNAVLKPAFGRERPYESGGATVFQPFSSNASFPSGHTAQAFTVASVIAMRSEGWIVPTLSYTVASMVAVSRVYQQAHFPSDTLVGAVLGNAVARFVVNRHRPPAGAPDALRISLVALPGGLAAHGSW